MASAPRVLAVPRSRNHARPLAVQPDARFGEWAACYYLFVIRMLDHVVFVARDLAATTADYRSRGFTVVPGGEHADGLTHNALVAFADGAYLELVAFLQPAPQHRWWRHAAGAGFADFALLSDDLDADVAALGDLVTRPGADGGRTRPDGVTLRWRTALLVPPLPFLIQDHTARDQRVPGGDAARHANGVTGIATVAIAARDERSARAGYDRLRARGAPQIQISGADFDGPTAVGFAGLARQRP